MISKHLVKYNNTIIVNSYSPLYVLDVKFFKPTREKFHTVIYNATCSSIIVEVKNQNRAQTTT